MQGMLSSKLDQALSDVAVTQAKLTMAGETHTVCAKPLTPADFSIVNRNLKLSGAETFQNNPMNFDGQIAMIVLKCRIWDAEGETVGDKAFAAADKPKLSRMGISWVSDLFSDLFSAQLDAHSEDIDDTAKK
jgi:hypothetical protein